MSSEYRFLRFEIVGLATLVFLLIGLSPMIKLEAVTGSLENVSTSISIIAGLFLFSIPLGYWEHQLVVNIYRSEKQNRLAHLFLRDLVLEAQESDKAKKSKTFFDSLSPLGRSALLTGLLDMCIYSRKSVASADIYERLGDRWSHFYARRAVGRYAPIASILLWGVALILGYFFSWPMSYMFEWQRILISVALWIAIFASSIRIIDNYSGKIWAEINFIESGIVLSNKEENRRIVSEVVKSLAEHPEYIQQAEKSYGISLYKM